MAFNLIISIDEIKLSFEYFLYKNDILFNDINALKILRVYKINLSLQGNL